jgi:succinate dehydrogenase / fumarate reductase cytochrome b subunit
MAKDKSQARPLSPHLQVFRMMLSMMVSITHRITGAALYFGFLLFAWWLLAAASGPDYFDYVQSLFTSWFGRLVLFGFTWALMFHLLGGIRHLIWDTGRALDIESVDMLAQINAAGSVLLTILVWIVAYLVR